MRVYDTREITHGNSWGAFSKIVKKIDGTLDENVIPTIFTGLRGVSFDTTQESNTYYADNVPHVMVRGNKTTEGSITCYQIPKKFLLDHLGLKESESGGLVDTGTGQNFIWQFCETITDEFGIETEQLTIYYNVQAAAPTAESSTDEDAVEPKEFEIPCTASPNSLVLDEDGKTVTYMILRKTEANAPLFDLAYTQIVLPTTAIPAP
jgi:hypothetical protein